MWEAGLQSPKSHRHPWTPRLQRPTVPFLLPPHTRARGNMSFWLSALAAGIHSGSLLLISSSLVFNIPSCIRVPWWFGICLDVAKLDLRACCVSPPCYCKTPCLYSSTSHIFSFFFSSFFHPYPSFLYLLIATFCSLTSIKILTQLLPPLRQGLTM